ncbi:MAG: ABC transporter ATP-binding protein/permease [Lachnospiraceae bacterium]|nr:ABC transporter ATP-binding protein/permease [Lachnospiraceae bacterium]
MKKKKKTKEIGNGKALLNTLYSLKLMWKISPAKVIHSGLMRLIGYFEWLFYSAFFMVYVINSLEKGEAFSRMLIFVGITASVFICINIYYAYINGKFTPETEPKINAGIYKELLKKAVNVELECYEDSDFYDKYTLAMEKADVRLTSTVESFFGVVFGFFASVFAFIYMFNVDHYSILFILFPVIGNFVFNRVVSKIAYQRNKDMAPHNRTVAYVNRVMYMTEYAKELRLTNVFKLMRRQYRTAIDGMSKVAGKYTVKSIIFHWLYVNFTFTFIFEGMLAYGAYRALVSQTLSLAQLAVITSMMVSTTWILIGFTDSITASFQNGLFIEYLKSFLEYKEKIPEDMQGEDPGSVIESLEFRNVSFAYKDKKVIDGLNMKFEAGKTYALVGHNGAGKTTLIKLLLRFYDPTEGEIYLNGKDIRTFELRKYRELFATAFQDNRIFSMSVLDNVLMKEGNNDESDKEEAQKALELAGVYDKIMSLPQGMDTILTREFDDKGELLSGGETQKIVVARAFVKKSPFKVFDEPSSALDPIAEYRLFENISKYCSDNILVFISHRLSSVKNADMIYLLGGGKVSESGTHEELIKLNKSYADMYIKQARNYLADDEYEEVM